MSVGFRDRWGADTPPPPAKGRVRTRPSRARVNRLELIMRIRKRPSMLNVNFKILKGTSPSTSDYLLGRANSVRFSSSNVTGPSCIDPVFTLDSLVFNFARPEFLKFSKTSFLVSVPMSVKYLFSWSGDKFSDDLTVPRFGAMMCVNF